MLGMEENLPVFHRVLNDGRLAFPDSCSHGAPQAKKRPTGRNTRRSSVMSAYLNGSLPETASRRDSSNRPKNSA